MQDHFFNAYELLGIKSNATITEIKKAYKLKAQEFHPDKYNNSHPANAMFKLIVKAKDILSNPQTRLQHDYATGIKVKSIPTPEPEVVYINETENTTDWGTIIGAGLIGLAVGAAIKSRKKPKRTKKT